MSKWPRWVFGVAIFAAGFAFLLSLFIFGPSDLQIEPTTLIASLPPIYWIGSLVASLSTFVAIVSFYYLVRPKPILASYVIPIGVGGWELIQVVFRALSLGWDRETLDALIVGGSFALAGVVAYLTMRERPSDKQGLTNNTAPPSD